MAYNVNAHTDIEVTTVSSSSPSRTDPVAAAEWHVSRRSSATLSFGFLYRFAHLAQQIAGSPAYHTPFSERRLLLVSVDLLCLLIAVWGALFLWSLISIEQVISFHEYWHWFAGLLVGWMILAALNDLYDVPSSYDRSTSVLRIVAVFGCGAVIYLAVLYLFPTALPYGIFPLFLTIALTLILLWRLAFTFWAALISRTHTVLVMGLGARGHSIAEMLQQAPLLNYRVLGYINDGTALPQPVETTLPVLGQMADLLTLVQQHQVHEIVVATEQELTKDTFDLLIACQAQGVQISWLPDLYEKFYRSIPIQYIDPAWALYAMQGQRIFSRLQLAGKRLLDLAIILLSLPTLLLLLPVIALTIRLDSAGPIFYRQQRCGRGGKLFNILKFRTMVQDAEKDGKPQWATKRDPRITRVGRILRKTRLDELPQVFNILVGDMSLVGPRPERPEFVAQLQQEIPFYQVRLMVKPGLTGWAQVHYDYGNSVEDALRKLQYDFYYIRYWSLWLDLYIIFRTIGVVLRFKGL